MLKEELKVPKFNQLTTSILEATGWNMFKQLQNADANVITVQTYFNLTFTPKIKIRFAEIDYFGGFYVQIIQHAERMNNEQ